MSGVLFAFASWPYWQSGDVFEVILRITFLNAYIHMFTLNTALLKHSSSHRPFRNCVPLMLSDICLALLRLLARIPCGLDMGTLARSREERGRDRHTYGAGCALILLKARHP